LDQSATILAKICQLVLDDSIPDPELRIRLYENIPQTSLSAAVNCVTSIVRPKNDVYFQELDKRYRTFRLFLPSLLSMIQFEGNADGEPLIAALNWLKIQMIHRDPNIKAPSDIIKHAWKANIYGKREEDFNLHAYVFCVLDCLQSALKRRDVFISPSWRYSDPRAHLLSGAEWETCKPMVCRALNLSYFPSESMNALVHELDQTYKAVASRFVDNANVRIESGKLKLTPIDKIEEPLSLIELRKRVHSLLPRVDLPELILEVASKTEFTKAFTHISENSSRAEDIELSICAVIMSEACNTGFEPLIKPGLKALKRDRLSWVAQNYLREKTIKNANAILVKAHSELTLSSLWGGGEIASADGMRFTVPVKTVHAGPNPKYFGPGKGVTWYNLLSDQHSGLNDLPVPGTLRDSLSLLAVVLEQQTELQPTEIMTDTGAYSDVIFGLFRLLGYRFSPRLADIGSRRFWRIDTKADYGELNDISTNMIKLNKIIPYWEDMLRLSGSLKLGKLSALDAMKTLQVGDKPTGLAKAIAEYGRIDKTIHLLTYIDDEAKRHGIQKQLNRVEGRHNLAREVFHGKRGELRKKYREGQEDQLGSLGLMLNIIVYWNTLYIEAALGQLRAEGYVFSDEDAARLSPLIWFHINMLGRYTFTVPDDVSEGRLRPLRDPSEEGDNP
jgi:TnpA family transposase